MTAPPTASCDTLRRMKALAVLLLAITLAGCTSTAPNVAPAATVDDDEFQIKATVLAVYNVISGPAGRRDWNRFEALFAPDARMIVVRDTPVVLTPKDYIARSKPTFDEKGWFERPVATRVLHYGDIAHVWSTYEGREASNAEEPLARGINSFQLVRIGGEWKVQEIVWQQEDAAHPIPPQFAPQPNAQ